MNGDTTARMVIGLVWVVILVSAFAGRKVPLRESAKIALAWLLIFGSIFVLFSFHGEAGRVWQRVVAEISPGGSLTSDGQLRLRKAEDGHFYADVTLNTHQIRMLVDSGATTTSLSAQTAADAQIDVSTSGFPVIIETANGTAEARRARVARIKVGPIERADWPVLVGDNLGEMNLLGMDFLSSLKGWRVEGDEMLLNP